VQVRFCVDIMCLFCCTGDVVFELYQNMLYCMIINYILILFPILGYFYCLFRYNCALNLREQLFDEREIIYLLNLIYFVGKGA